MAQTPLRTGGLDPAVVKPVSGAVWHVVHAWGPPLLAHRLGGEADVPGDRRRLPAGWTRRMEASVFQDPATVRFLGADILSGRGRETAEEARCTYGSMRGRPLPAAEIHQPKVVMASHVFHACLPERRFAYRDQQLAETTIWWHEQTGSRLV